MEINAAGPAKLPPAEAPKAAPTPVAPAPKVGTDELKLSRPAEEEQYFGHAPKITLSMLLKQPIWQDDRTKVSAEQWAQMPEGQRAKILAMIPTEPARKQFLSYVDPATAAARAWAGEVAHKAAEAIRHYGEPDQQVDKLNALIESKD
jgi:hypothetical protein